MVMAPTFRGKLVVALMVMVLTVTIMGGILMVNFSVGATNN